MAYGSESIIRIELRKYATAAMIPFFLSDQSGSSNAIAHPNYTPDANAVKINLCTNGTGFDGWASTTNTMVAVQNAYPGHLVRLTAAEMTCKMALIYVNGSGTGTQPIQSAVLVYTFGDASAMYPMDFSSSVPSIAALTIAPVQTNVATSLKVETDVTVYKGAESPALTWTVVDANNAPIDLSSATLSFKVYDRSHTTLFSKSTSSGITVSGSSSNLVTVTYNSTDTAMAGAYRYSLWRTDGSDIVYASGDFIIQPIVK